MKKKQILFEAGPMIDDHKTGVGYYVDHLISTLGAKHSNDIELTGYYFNFLNRKYVKPQRAGVNFSKITVIPGKLLSLCRRFGFQPFLEIFIRREADLILFTNYVSLPLLGKKKKALVVYDLSFLDYPEFTQTINLTYLQRFCKPSIEQADLIITISEFTKDRLKYHFPESTAKMIVTPIPPISINADFKELGKSLLDLGIKKDRYILYLGTLEPRKNIESLVSAYSNLPAATRSQYSLVLAGGKGWKDEGIIAAISDAIGKNLDIIQTGYISDSMKSELYSNASCFVLPSHYEGFGMPILEAMQYKLPIAISDLAVFHEVASNGALYFDKDNPDDISRKIMLLLYDKDLGIRLVEKGQRQLKTFSWTNNADLVYSAIKEITSKP